MTRYMDESFNEAFKQEGAIGGRMKFKITTVVEHIPRYGDIFTFGDGKENYILAQVEASRDDNGDMIRARVCLIGMTHGNRWDDPSIVADPLKLTEDEVDTIFLNSNGYCEADNVDWRLVRKAKPGGGE